MIMICITLIMIFFLLLHLFGAYPFPLAIMMLIVAKQQQLFSVRYHAVMEFERDQLFVLNKNKLLIRLNAKIKRNQKIFTLIVQWILATERYNLVWF